MIYWAANLFEFYFYRRLNSIIIRWFYIRYLLWVSKLLIGSRKIISNRFSKAPGKILKLLSKGIENHLMMMKLSSKLATYKQNINTLQIWCFDVWVVNRKRSFGWNHIEWQKHSKIHDAKVFSLKMCNLGDFSRIFSFDKYIGCTPENFF